MGTLLLREIFYEIQPTLDRPSEEVQLSVEQGLGFIILSRVAKTRAAPVRGMKQDVHR
jgi:hypothetical protein